MHNRLKFSIWIANIRTQMNLRLIDLIPSFSFIFFSRCAFSALLKIEVCQIFFVGCFRKLWVLGPGADGQTLLRWCIKRYTMDFFYEPHIFDEKYWFLFFWNNAWRTDLPTDGRTDSIVKTNLKIKRRPRASNGQRYPLPCCAHFGNLKWAEGGTEGGISIRP